MSVTVPNSVKYVLVTPVKNEERLIGITIESVVNQTCRPAEWVIVSDGSTDRTNEIVESASVKHPWIRLLKLPVREGRNFAAVVHATEAGVKHLTVADYKYVGLLDSDLRFKPDYIGELLGRFESNPKLGMGGGAVLDVDGGDCKLPRNREDIPGASQFFRRECFERLGGLVAIPEGGWDALTCARARMLGYETKLFVELVVDHLKPRSVSEGGILRRRWSMGVRDYALGCHPLFETLKCVGRALDAPPVVGTVAWWLGYMSAWLGRRPRIVPPELLEFVSREQLGKVKKLLRLGG